MLVVIPTHAGDIAAATELLHWILKLGQNKTHDCLIVADAGTPFDRVKSAREVAAGIFKEVRIITNGQSVKGWPQGCYSLFRTTTKFIADYWPQPFLILEPDAVPLRSGWLDDIAAEYKSGFMGHIYDGEGRYAGGKFMSGIAVYPADAEQRLPKFPGPVHWDVEGAPIMVSQGTHTNLIKHLFGHSPEAAPTFIVEKTASSPPNALTLDYVEGAAIFHRNKDGSLRRLLARKLFPRERVRENITVVFPVCRNDIHLGLKHLQWLQRLVRSRWPHEAIVAWDSDTPVVLVNQFEAGLRNCFAKVSSFHYHRAPIPGWPMAANWMFQNIAHKMTTQDRSWLLLEPDAVVLRHDWLEKIQAEYESCGKNFMGPHVKGMQHSNGVMVYPPDTPQRIPRGIQSVQQAWDYMMAPEMMHDCHDCSHVLQHIWTIVGDDAIEVGGGEAPEKVTPERARRWIKPGAAVIHRIKDDSLINLLLGGFNF